MFIYISTYFLYLLTILFFPSFDICHDIFSSFTPFRSAGNADQNEKEKHNRKINKKKRKEKKMVIDSAMN